MENEKYECALGICEANGFMFARRIIAEAHDLCDISIPSETGKYVFSSGVYYQTTYDSQARIVMVGAQCKDGKF